MQLREKKNTIKFTFTSTKVFSGKEAKLLRRLLPLRRVLLCIGIKGEIFSGADHVLLSFHYRKEKIYKEAEFHSKLETRLANALHVVLVRGMKGS